MTEEKKRVSLFMPVSLIADLKELAQANGMDMSTFIRSTLIREVEKLKK